MMGDHLRSYEPAVSDRGKENKRSPSRARQVTAVSAVLVGLGSLGTSASATAGAQDVQIRLGPIAHVSADRPDVPHAEPHLAIHPVDPNRLLAGAIVMPDGEVSVIEILYSTDGGEHWTRSVLPDMQDTWGGDPWVAFDAEGRPAASLIVRATEGEGLVVLLYTADALGGAWSGPVLVGPGGGGSWDQQKIAVAGRTGDGGGTLLVVGDKWGPRTADGNSTGAVGVALIGDGGRGPARIDHTQANNASKSPSAPVVLSDGSVVTLFHEYLANGDASSRGWIGGLWSIASTDGGRSFGARNYVAKDLRPGMIALAADTSRNPDMLYAVWPSTAGAIHVATSDSRGDRWSAPVPIGPLDDGDVATLAAATDGQGAVAMLWSAAADAPEGSVCRDIWFAATRDGKTFSSPTRLQDGTSCVVVEGGPTFRFDDAVTGTYERFGRGGEYFGLVGLPNGGFYALWVDATTGELQLMGRRVTLID